MNLINQLTDFIIKHLKYINKEQIKEYIKEHQQYGTIDYGMDENRDIVAVVRWNIKQNIAEVLDFAIREDFRNQGVGTDFIIRAKNRFPEIEYLEFKRGVRGDNRVRKLNINRILRKNIL